jgi:hypothetical protein
MSSTHLYFDFNVLVSPMSEVHIFTYEYIPENTEQKKIINTFQTARAQQRIGVCIRLGFINCQVAQNVDFVPQSKHAVVSVVLISHFKRGLFRVRMLFIVVVSIRQCDLANAVFMSTNNTHPISILSSLLVVFSCCSVAIRCNTVFGKGARTGTV